jgi:endonuclease YncB( thermonuclease family)
LIHGEFHLFYTGKRKVGSQPDGDSLWFKPANPKWLKGFDGRNAKLNPGGFAQLRFEGIDAVELHFESTHQDMPTAIAARDFNLRDSGFKTVSYSGATGLSVKDAAPHPIEGHILTNAIDPYGRPVAFVFKGSPGKADGSSVYLDTKMLDKSINADLARSGNAFPAFYTGLPVDLRRHVAKLTTTAKKSKKGIWSKDKTEIGLTVSSKTSLENAVIWPKLYRRAITYFKTGKTSIAGFDAWLRDNEKKDDGLWIISEGMKGNMHDVVKVSGNKLSMIYRPDDIVVEPQ